MPRRPSHATPRDVPPPGVEPEPLGLQPSAQTSYARVGGAPARRSSSSSRFGCHRARSRGAQRAPRAWMHPRSSRAHLGSHAPAGFAGAASRGHDRELILLIMSRYVSGCVVSCTSAGYCREPGARRSSGRPKRRRATEFPWWPFRTTTLVTSFELKAPGRTAERADRGIRSALAGKQATSVTRTPG